MREMKNSGIEWIGEIPTAWKLTKIGSAYSERNIKVSDKEYMPLSITKLGVVPQLETAAKTDNGDNRKLVKKNDFVINSRSDRRGSCGISDFDGSCSLINTVLKPRKNMCNAYYSYVFKSELFADEFYRWGNGIVDDLWSTKWTNMKRIYIPAPSLDEQHRIADFLDEKCAKIDAVIEKQKQVIEKLKEYKLSVITEAVTKGLDPTVPMKDSGVEWIGEMPEGWKLTKIKNFIKLIESGVSVNAGQNEASTGELGVLKTSSVSKFVFDVHENKSVNKDEENRVSCPVKANTIIVSRMNTPDLVGACGYVDKDYNNIFLPDRLWQVHFIDGIIVKFIWYYLRSNSVRNYISSLSTGTSSSMQNISQGQFCNTLLLIPPIEEQSKIIDILDKKCIGIDFAIYKKQAIIEKLTEYKKSLIYEVVTGKREV